MRRVAVLVAASPTDAFYSQVAVLKIALQRLHWSRWQPSLHLYLGGPSDPGAFEKWSPHLRGVTIHRAPAAHFALSGDWAQSDDVFLSAPPEADVFLAMDADTLPVNALEPVLDQVLDTNAIAGVIAHYPPFPRPASPIAPTWISDAWQDLARGLLDRPLDLCYSHTLMGEAQHRVAPFYLNFGVVFFSRDAFHRVTPRYLAIRPLLMDRLSFPDFSGQVALTLAIASERVRTWALPMRYNFPNDAIAEQMYPTELELAAVFHYLRTEAFDRHQIFATAGQYRTFQGIRLQGVNRRFQEAVRTIVGEQYPFD